MLYDVMDATGPHLGSPHVSQPPPPEKIGHTEQAQTAVHGEAEATADEQQLIVCRSNTQTVTFVTSAPLAWTLFVHIVGQQRVYRCG